MELSKIKVVPQFCSFVIPGKVMHSILLWTILQFLFLFVSGQGPGNGVKEYFTVYEEQPGGTSVGNVSIIRGMNYRFSSQSDLFFIDSGTGEIKTTNFIDREDLQNGDTFDIFVQNYPDVTHIIEVEITVLDMNDNSPEFPNPKIEISFSEINEPGSMHTLDTATDRDIGVNDVTSNYRIVSGNEDERFKLVILNDTSTLLLLAHTQPLDREEKSSYKLNISAQDGGTPPRFGYLTADITIQDLNDNKPLFDQSDYLVTVNETIAVGSSIIKVTATDMDIGENAEIEYSVSGSEQDQFWIDPRTGVLQTLKKLQCSPGGCSGNVSGCNNEYKSCVVNVQATDNGHPKLVGNAYVTVQLIDENDNDPTITIIAGDGNNAYIDEGAAVDDVVAFVSVHDPDEGLNGNTTVRIIPGDGTEYFKLVSLNYDTYYVHIAKSIASETRNLYNLTIEARDRGEPPRSSTVNLLIFVNDINDHVPRFVQSSYRADLSELLPVGSFVASVTAVDNDTGINAQITYSFVNGFNDWFQINNATGLVTTRRRLDREQSTGMTLTIKAQDGASTPTSSQVDLVIVIYDENDETPTFDNDVYYRSIPENASPSVREVITVTAIDEDQGNNGTVTYEFHPDVNILYPNLFTLSSSGRVRTARILDREEFSEFHLVIIAKDGGTPSLSSSTTVIITVEDENDNMPVFYPGQYFAYVRELQPAVDVIQVLCQDADSGENARITYFLLSGDSAKFQVDPMSGMVSTKTALNRATKSKYTLTIRATDGGGDTAENSATVTVFVVPEGEVIPSFSESSYSFRISEDNGMTNPVTGREVVRRMSVIDFTSNPTFLIMDGDPNGVFNIGSSNGRITTARALDREDTEVYTLQVVAQTPSQFAATTVVITIDDVNDNRPRYFYDAVSVEVAENAPEGYPVYYAAALDEDAGNNARLTYTMTQDSNNLFNLDASTGMITLSESVLGKIDTFQVQVTAVDGGSSSLNARQTIDIVITDVNDITPTFEQQNYVVTLLENTPVNQQFLTLEAVDSDVGMNGKIEYIISDGNDGKTFGIFPNGELFIAHALDRERQDIYVLSVTARDMGSSPRMSTTNVTIYILDANDNEPEFTNSTFSFLLEEETDFGTFVGVLSATDADIDQNSELLFSFEEDNFGFVVDPKTGIVTSGRRFDRENLWQETGASTELILTAVVTDMGSNPKSSKATVRVTISDANDNAPVFTKQVYDTEISEDADINRPVVQINARDDDIEENAMIRYEIIDGNVNNKFAINSETGQITIASRLDREVQDLYTLTIQAVDSGVVPMTSTTVARIQVLDANDNRPVFDESELTFSVLESAIPGDFITQFTATDADLYANAYLSYSMSGSNAFSIDARSGKLSVAMYLDFENIQERSHTLTITASDNGSPSLTASIEITVTVIDVNDNSPVFVNTPVGEVLENSGAMTPVMTITATDVDEDSDIMYEIIAQNPPGDHFNIDPNNGRVTTASAIDREFTNNFHLTIVAYDAPENAPIRNSAEIEVNVVVLDENDNDPRFTSQLAAYIEQGSSPNTKFAVVTAVDPDEGENGRLQYEITNGGDKFRIDSESGELYLRTALRPQELFFDITISVKDNGDNPRSELEQMRIFVTENPPTGPEFVNPDSYSVEKEENSTDRSVLTVSANDTGDQLEYYITSVTTQDGTPAPRLFEIRRDTGVIRTVDGEPVLDRESELAYTKLNIEVFVRDSSSSQPRTRSTQVEVTVLDRNDSPPRFGEALYTANVAENVSPGSVIITVEAQDPDSEGSIQYNVVDGGDEKFAIDSSTGVLSVVSRLDREDQSEYVLTVGAYDGVHLSSTKVKVTVTDVNDEKPVFTQPAYFFDVPENTETGVSVGHVTAIDGDVGQNAQVTYSILSQWGRDKFSLGRSTGVLQLIGELNYEEVEHYVLTIQAQDSGSSRQSSTVTVYMNVIDENDNSPIFDPSSYNIEVHENETIGASIMQVAATDSDSAENSEIRYYLRGGDLRGVFNVDAVTGILSLASNLDRESQSRYNLAVEARDLAGENAEVLSGTALISVTVKDVNDNAPVFDMPNTVHVRENSPVGTVISTLTVTDADEEVNGQVRFSLGSSQSNLFAVDANSGEMTLQGRVDRETLDRYTVVVVATDRGSPPLATQYTITVVITDDNDFSPRFERESYQTTIDENVKVGTSLLTVSATDNDIGLNAELRYSITGGDSYHFFHMNSYTGELGVAHGLDYELFQRHELEITVQDLGQPTPRMDTTMVTVIVQDVNDYTPTFLNTPYMASVMENIADTPVNLLTVSARDRDIGQNGRIQYSLTGGDSNIFAIDGTSGVITVKRQLDREARSFYTLVVQAKDSGIPRRSSSTTIHVDVADENDHSPEFEHGHYRGLVLENAQAPVTVAMVTALDPDAGDNGRVQYALADDGFGHFAIDPISGVITTTRALDREVQAHFTLVVMATDGGLRMRTSEVQVSVQVEDVNDNMPVFQKEAYTFYIKDPTPYGDFVAGVTAVDPDEGLNGQVEYSLLGDTDLDIEIDEKTGVITAGSRLSAGNGENSYSFTVRATDKGLSALPQETVVELVFLQHDTSQFPRIDFSPSSRIVWETQDVDFVIATVSGSSTRPGNALSYYIVGGNIDDTFEIRDRVTIGLRKKPDFETTEAFNLWVEVRDEGIDPPLSGYGQMAIRVTDGNDNPPVFDKVYYNASVVEDQNPEIFVTEVTASDADQGDNGRISYEIVGGDNKFAIDNEGVIRTVMRLDRESVDNYHLVVKATDNGSPKNTATATVDIRVLDTNDNPPRFTEIFATMIPENAKLGTEVFKITTTDKDIGINTRHVYNFTSNPGRKFAIDPYTGIITVAGRLDREAQNEYNLRLSANDGKFTQETSWIVDVLDINDVAPQFEQNEYTFAVAEEQGIGTKFGTVSASDRDADGANSEVFYYFKYPNHAFHIDSESGELSIREELLFNPVALSQNERQLIVVASDRGDPMLTTEVPVIVEVRPANRHSPVFEQPEGYEIAVAQDSSTGMVVLTIHASDDDFGDNAQLTYTATGGDAMDYFVIDEQTGDISVSSSIQGQRNLQFSMNVVASDNGLPVRSSSVTVTMDILESNGYTPIVLGDADSFRVTVSENIDVGETIATISARDPDQGINGEISYFIDGGDPNEQFSIGQTSGGIKVEKPLDYEEKSSYDLSIRISDNAPIPKFVNRTFRVILEDINDNAPTFESHHIDAFIPENSPIDSSVVAIQAKDPDSANNAVVHYSIVQNSMPEELFTITETSGVILTNAEMNFEVEDEYSFAVKAMNPGTDLSGTAAITVHVTSVNEYAPVFEQRYYYFDVSESASPGTVINHVKATDEDKGIDGVVLYYLVEDSNTEGFIIDATTGAISIAEPIDREAQDTIVLRILAKNSGPIRGDDTDECEVRIFVGDANDPPRFQQSVYRASVSEGAVRDTSVIRVKAEDSDLEENFRDFEYSISMGNINNAFKIDVTSGLVSVNGRLDRESTSSYTLRIEARDSGTPPQTGSTTVQITIDDINDNGPYFQPNMPVGNLTEGQPPSSGAVAIDLSEYTFDLDIDPNRGPYTYFLTSHTDVFRIDESEVKARVQLNREEKPEYIVSVNVTDDGNPPMMSSLLIKIQVIDINDNPSNEDPLEVLVYAYEGQVSDQAIANVHPRDTDLVGNYQCDLMTNTREFRIPSGCDLHAIISNVNSPITRTLQVRGNDGVHGDVEYDVTVKFEPFSQETIDNSIVMRISDTDVTTFLSGPHEDLVSEMNTRLGVTTIMYNVHDGVNKVDIFIAAKSRFNYLTSNQLETQLLEEESRIEQATGLSLLINYKPCDETPCFNGGTCSTEPLRENSYLTTVSGNFIFSAPDTHLEVKCQCPEEFTGNRCTEPRNKCQENPCAHGGTCSSLGDGLFTCECTEAWTGDTCEEDVNECSAGNMCLNGGTCLNHEGYYSCRCPSSHTGDHCEIYVGNCQDPQPCENGGTCVSVGNGYRCECDFGYSGQNCEIAPKGFESSSYLRYNKALQQNRNRFQFEFATVSENALLLYYPHRNSGQFLALEIIDGRIRLSFALGDRDSDIVRVTSPRRVNDGNWYIVTAERNQREGAVSVSRCENDNSLCTDLCRDGDASCHATASGGQYTALVVNERSLFIGGVDSTETLTRHSGHVNSHDFVGCMRHVQIENGDVFVDWAPISQRGVVAGCPRAHDVCDVSDVCGAGTCVDNWTEQSCECPIGKTGDTCEQEETEVGFGSNTVVTYTLSESYKRDLALAGAGSRRKRQTTSPGYSLSLNFRTNQEDGLMIYATAGNSQHLKVMIEGGKVVCETERGSLTVDRDWANGDWHNLTVVQQDTSVTCSVGGVEETGNGDVIPYGVWDSVQLSGEAPNSDVPGFEGCMESLLVNGEPLPMSGYSAKYTINASGATSAGCSGFGSTSSEPEKKNPSTQIVVIVICTFFGIAIIAILSVILFIRMRRKLKEKQGIPKTTNINGFTKTNGDISNKSLTTNDSGRSHKDSGYGEDGGRNEELIIQQHIQQELNQHNFNEREVRASGTSLHSTRPDIIVQDEKLPNRRSPGAPDLDPDAVGIDNIGYLEEAPEHYDLDNASSIAPSDVYDFAAHYKQYRKNHNVHNKFRPPNKHLHQRTTPSPSNMLSAKDRQSPASVSMQMHRHSPASMLDRDSPNGMIIGRASPHVKSQLTVENVNQLNRQTPVNQLSRTSPAPRSTPLSGIQALYPSNISNSSYSGRESMPNGHPPRGSRPNSKLKQPINQVGMRGTPTKGLTIEEVNRLNARYQSPLSTLDAISSSSEDMGKNDINRTDFTHADLLDPAAHLPPESSSEDETNDSFTCSEFESDHEKIRNDVNHSAGRLFKKLPAVNEHEDTDTTIASRGRVGGGDTDSNRESHSTFFTASEDELPRRIGRTKLPNGALSLDYMLNWGPNYEKLVGVFSDIALLPQDDNSIMSQRVNKPPSRPSSTNSNRPPSRLSQSQSPHPILPPKPNNSRMTSPRGSHGHMGSISSLSSTPGRHQGASPLPKAPLASPVPPGAGGQQPMMNGHIKQTSLVSLASSHDRQSSISSVHSMQSSRSGRSSGKHLPISPLANGLNVTQHHGSAGAPMMNGGLVSHSRSSSRSSNVSSRPSHTPHNSISLTSSPAGMYSGNPYPAVAPHNLGGADILPSTSVHTSTEAIHPNRNEEYV